MPALVFCGCAMSWARTAVPDTGAGYRDRTAVPDTGAGYRDRIPGPATAKASVAARMNRVFIGSGEADCISLRLQSTAGRRVSRTASHARRSAVERGRVVTAAHLTVTRTRSRISCEA